jgi:glutathione reductase (NADPH)
MTEKEMASFDFDLFTIGAGSGGVAASRRAAAHGARVAICEGSRVGGTCVIRGCIPKKLLMYGAQFRDAFEDAAGFGWQVPPPAFDWPTLIANKDKEIDRLNGIYISMLRNAGVTLFEGFGRLVDAHTVEVAGKRYTARKILIATGGRPVKPPIPGAEHTLTSDDVLDLSCLPHSMIILGGGYIAVEFASILAAFGVEVSMLVRGEALLTGFDGDVRVHLARQMSARGIEIHTRTLPVAIEKDGTGAIVRSQIGQEFSAGAVFAATGRAPNTYGLGLEELGVEMTPRGGIKVDDRSRTSVESIYSIGDVTDRVALTPVAIAEGRAFADTEFAGTPVEVSYLNIPTGVFSNPPVGTAGLTEENARRLHGAVDVYCSAFRPMKNTLSGREERTLMKMIVDRATQRVLGCHMVGPDAPEIVQGLAVALNCGATKQQFDRTIALHPSAAEEFVLMRERLPDPPEAEAAD